MTTWFGQKVFDQSEVDELGSLELPCEYQVGTEVWLHILNDGDTYNTPLDAIVAGVTISTNHKIAYDLLFKVAEGFYVKVSNFRGSISRKGEYITDSGLVSREAMETIIKENPESLESADATAKEILH